MTTDIDELVEAIDEAAQVYREAGVLDQPDAPFNKVWKARQAFLPKLVYVMPEWEEFKKGKRVNNIREVQTGSFWVKFETYNALREATRVEEKE